MKSKYKKGDRIKIKEDILFNNFEVEEVRRINKKTYYLINFDNQLIWLSKERVK